MLDVLQNGSSVRGTVALLEARVLELVDAVLSGSKIEDSLVECKRTWPLPDKARQLAGSANAAQGEDMLLIIGLDEDAQEIASVDDIDPATWWSQITSQFDQETAPNLERHIRVPLDNGQSVIALEFSTDRAPYVVKVKGGGSPEREIPMRDGTRTKSATRAQLIRMLAPRILAPAITLAEVSLTCTRYAQVGQSSDPGFREARVSISGHISIYIEHINSQVAVIPAHLMAANLQFGDSQVSLAALRIVSDSFPEQGNRLAFGVHANGNQLVCTASGHGLVKISAEVDKSQQDIQFRAFVPKLSFSAGLAGSSSRMSLSENLYAYPVSATGVSGHDRIAAWRWVRPLLESRD